jgi:PAS domain S-box-containing protein
MKDAKKKNEQLIKSSSESSPQFLLSEKTKSTKRNRTASSSPSTTNYEFLKSILDSIDTLIYVADMETCEVLFLNKYGKKIWGNIEGKQCWQTLRTDQKGPCQICTNDKLIDAYGKPKGLHIWEFQNTVTQKWYECWDLAIRWTDKLYARLEIASDITERKETEENLRKSESKYRSTYNMMKLMCDNVPDMIWAKDLERKYIFTNKAICESLLNAKNTDEPIGKTDIFFAQREQASHPDNPCWHTFGEICGDSDSMVMTEKRPQRFDEFGNVKNTFLYLDVHKAPFFDEKGNLIGTVGAGRDVTQEKKIAQHLRQTERQLHIITDSLPVLIAYIDRDQRYRYVNKTFEDWFGTTKEEMYGKHIRDIVGDNAYSILQGYIEKTLAGKRIAYEEKLAYKNGGTRFVSGIMVPDVGVNSEAKGFYAVVSDISERKEMEEALRAGEERYHALFQSIPIGVGIATMDGKIVAYNEMMQKITGYSKYTLDHINAKDLYYNKEDREKLADILKGEGVVHNFETILKRKNGTLFHASLNMISYPLGDEDGILTALEDISERKKAEKALVDSERRLSYIINFLPDATFAINMEGQIIAWNRAIEQMTGVPSIQVLGKDNYEHGVHFYGKRRPVLADLVLKPDREIEKTYTFITREMDCLIAEPIFPVIILGETRYLWAKASPMYDTDGNIIGAIESIRDITKRKTVEATLKKSEQTVQILLNANPETELLVNKEGTILAGNNTFAKRIGKEIHDIIGKPFSAMFPPDIANTRETKMKEAAETGQLVHFTDSRDGTIYDNYHYPVFNENGNIEMVAIFAMDITDRIKVEEALRESEERYRTAIEFSNDGVAILKGSIHIYINKRFVTMFGYDNDREIIGKTHALTVHPDDLERVSNINRKRQEGGDVPPRYEFKGIKKNGDIIYIEASAANTLYQGESVSLAYLRDITERKWVEEELRVSEAKYRLLIDASSEGILVVQDGKLQFVNKKVIEVSGYRQEELMARPFPDLVHPDDREMMLNQYRKRVKSEIPDAYSFRITSKYGHVRWVDIRGTEFIWEGKPANLYFLNDVTMRKRIEEEIFLQHKLALALAKASTLEETLSVCIETAIKVSDMDSGAIYLVEKATAVMKLTLAEGVSDKFINKVAIIQANSQTWRTSMEGKSGYYASIPDKLLQKSGIEEGLLCIGIVPIRYKTNTVGYIIVSSHKSQEIPFEKRKVLEIIAVHVGNVVQRIVSESKYRSIFENTIEGIFQSTPPGTLISVNPAMASMFGYESPEDMITSLGNNDAGYYVKPEQWENFKHLLETEGTARNFEIEAYRKNKSPIWIKVNATTVKDEIGNTLYEGTIENITERKLSSDALRDSEIKYRTLLDNVNDAIFLMSKDVFVDCNEKALTVFGCSREDLIGKTPSMLSPPTQPDGRNSHEKAAEIIDKTLSGKAQFFEWEHSKLDGTVFDTEVSLNTIELGGKIYTQAIVRDVTQRKQYDQSLKMSLAKLRKATGGIIDVIVMAVEMRDPYTAGHQKRVASLARSIAKEMGLTEEIIDSIRMAGIIHDLGKISIPAEILTRPRKLTESEYDLVKTHPQIGYDILKDIVFPWPIAQIVHQHHERLNGSGYPKGIKQADILLEARIIAVCDVVESMASHRPYRPALGIDKALEEITTNKGILYDAAVVDTCVRLFRQKGFSFD